MVLFAGMSHVCVPPGLPYALRRTPGMPSARSRTPCMSYTRHAVCLTPGIYFASHVVPQACRTSYPRHAMSQACCTPGMPCGRHIVHQACHTPGTTCFMHSCMPEACRAPGIYFAGMVRAGYKTFSSLPGLFPVI